jgi:hypothetical protein
MTAYNIDAFGWAFAAEIARRNGDEAGRKACEREGEKAAAREAAEHREFMHRLRYSN